MSTTKLKIIGVFFMCLSVIFAGLSVYFYFQNSSSRAEIVENEKTIKTLEAEKIPLKNAIASRDKAIAKDKITIARLTTRETELLNLLKSQKNEAVTETSVYFSSDDDKRVELFAGLATGKD